MKSRNTASRSQRSALALRRASFSKSRAPRIFRNRKLQSAEEVARLGLDALARGQRTIHPKWSGRFTAFLVRFLPVGLITHFVEKAARPKP